MPRLSDAQFQNYEFRAQRTFGNNPTREGQTQVVVSRHGPEGSVEPLGAMTIHRHDMMDQDWEQNDIDQAAAEVAEVRRSFTPEGAEQHLDRLDLPHHGMKTEDSGQRRWTEGTMEPRGPDYVNWLGISKEAPKSVLKGMMALGASIHGSIPAADSVLSQHGAKISQGAARKYGIKPHPENPGMSQSFEYPEDDPRGDRGEHRALSKARGLYRASTDPGVSPEGVDFRESRWQSFSAAQVGDITTDVEVNMLGRKPGKIDPRVPVHPSQGKLFLSPEKLSFQFHSRGWVLNEQQRIINERGERSHGTIKEPSGQLRWTQGNFESRKP